MEELLINDCDLNTKRMLDLMAVREGEMPLYLHIVSRVLREMRIVQQRDGTPFHYARFKATMQDQGLTVGQLVPFQQRLSSLESFMPEHQTGTVTLMPKSKAKRRPGNDWTATVSSACMSMGRTKANHPSRPDNSPS